MSSATPSYVVVEISADPDPRDSIQQVYGPFASEESARRFLERLQGGLDSSNDDYTFYTVEELTPPSDDDS